MQEFNCGDCCGEFAVGPTEASVGVYPEPKQKAWMVSELLPGDVVLSRDEVEKVREFVRYCVEDLFDATGKDILTLLDGKGIKE